MYSKITIALAVATYDLAYGVELEAQGVLDWIPELTPHGPPGNGIGIPEYSQHKCESTFECTDFKHIDDAYDEVLMKAM